MRPADQSLPDTLPLKSSTSPLKLGAFRDIHKRSQQGCPFCFLVVKSVTNDSENQSLRDPELDNASCSLSWQLDGRKIRASGYGRNQSVRGLTRRIHLSWTNQEWKDAYLVFVAPERYTMTPSDADKVWDKRQLFMGRRVETDGSIQARIKSWVDLCKTQHRGPCNHVDFAARDRFEDMVSHSYFGVVDVQNMQLVACPTRKSGRGPKYETFAALSYVWGRTPTYVTTAENIPLLRTHGGVEKVLGQLPTVIKDAIDLTRRLGIQYIWIDALCIVQDSPRSWKLNAYNMDIIYGSADLTICAADGEDASMGLRAMRMGDHNHQQHMADCAPGVRLVVSRPPEMYIKESRWNTRAWTFQERLLSNRCLIFTAGRVYFQCRSTGMSEDIYADREAAGWSLDFVDAPMQMFQQLPQRAFWVYTKIVTLYTQRDLTKAEDILAAFSGIRNHMKTTMNAPYIFGLPSSHFDLALLWQHVQPVKRRQSAKRGGKVDVETTGFPSWCWTGWQGAARTYFGSMIDDVLDNVNEWLHKHTWIKWHVRDGRGDLRPLWDANDWEVDKSEDERWRGYGTERSAWPASMRPQTSRRRVTFGDQVYPSLYHHPDDPNPHSYPSYPSYEPRPHGFPARVRRASPAPDYPAQPYGGGHYVPHHSPPPRYNRPRSPPVGSPPPSPPLTRAPLPKTPRTTAYRDFSDGNESQISQEDEAAEGSEKPDSEESNVDQERDQRSKDRARRRSRPRYHSLLEPEPAIRSERRTSHLNHTPPGAYGEDRYSYVPPPPAPYRRPSSFVDYVPTQPYDDPYYNYPPPQPPRRSSLHAYPPADDTLYYPTAGQSGPSPAYQPHAQNVFYSPYPSQQLQYDYAHAAHAAPTPSSTPGHNSEFFDQFFDHGPHINREAMQANPKFNITLRDYPYNVVMAPFDRDLDASDHQPMPILQFWTYHAFLHIRSTPTLPSSDISDGLVRCHIGDSIGDWCGSIVLDAEWLKSQTAAKQEFVAISEAKRFTKAECETWTYYIPKEREQSESEWDLYYVMLVERKEEMWERVGLGKVFKEAFRGSTWKEIMLA